MDPGESDYSLPTQSTLRPPSNQGDSLLDTTPEQLVFVDAELARFVRTGAWKRSTNNIFDSRLFLDLKPGKNQWRLICDLKHMNV
jgi:hypothetical protein